MAPLGIDVIDLSRSLRTMEWATGSQVGVLPGVYPKIVTIELVKAIERGYLKSLDKPPPRGASGAPDIEKGSSLKPLSTSGGLLTESNTTHTTSGSSGSRTHHQQVQAPAELQVPEIIITRKAGSDAPNITVNSNIYSGRREIYLVAIIGTFLQLGVLIYSALATYYRTLRFKKDDSSVAAYAYPCMSVGTLVLVAGMLVCAHVVESSTKEEYYQAKEGKAVRMVWLQQEKAVSDQKFDSFAVFARDDRPFVTTSRRPAENEISTTWLDKTIQLILTHAETLHKTIVQYGSKPEPRKHSETDSEECHATVLAFKAVFGTTISLFGFVIQFVGLRGMHWSASVAQLGIVVTMAGLRAWVRRGFVTPPASKQLATGFELDWFATTLCNYKEAPWVTDSILEKETEGEKLIEWRMVTGRTKQAHRELFDPQSDDSQVIEELGANSQGESILRALDVMDVRRKLGQLAAWHGPGSTEAACLARSMEIVMDALLGSASKSRLHWCFEVHYAGIGVQPIYFRFERQRGNWAAYLDEIEAALSLWLYSVNKEENGNLLSQKARMPSKESEDGPDENDCAQSGSKAPSHGRSLRLLGPQSPSMFRDLRWWVPTGVPDVLGVVEDKNGVMEIENHRIVGSGGQNLSQESVERIDTSPRYHHEPRTTRYRSQQPEFDLSNLKVDQRGLLAKESYAPLALLYAQDMFSAFMSAVAMTLETPISGNVNIRHDDTGDDQNWQSFTLRNDQLSKMAQDVENTGLGSLSDIYLSIIPPLSKENKLPQADSIIQLARQHAKRHEQLAHWNEAGDIYLWLFHTSSTFSKQTISAKATAVLMEYQKQVTGVINLKEAQHERSNLQRLKELQSKLENNLQMADEEVQVSLERLYQEQGRNWRYIPKLEAKSVYPKVFNFTPEHRLAQDDFSWKTRIPEIDKKNLNSRDILGWTPLTYAIATGSTEVVTELLRSQVDVNVRDLSEWTPLHYASCGTKVFPDRTPILPWTKISPVRELIREGAEINAQGRDGMAPLHCAAMSGFDQAVRSLVEAGAAIDILDVFGNTPLLWATYKGHKDIVESPLHLAALAGKSQVCELLMDYKDTDIEANDLHDRTPILSAAVAGHLHIAKLLVRKHADINVYDHQGRTLTHLAAANGHLDLLVHFVTALGADAQAQAGLVALGGQALGGTARMSGNATGGFAKGGKIKRGTGGFARGGNACVPHSNVTDFDGYAVGGSAIGRQAIGGEAVAGYAEGGTAHAFQPDDIGCRTPLHLAAANGHVDICKFLIDERSIDKNVQDADQQTPLHLAAANGQASVVSFLIDSGADKEIRAGGKQGHGTVAIGGKALGGKLGGRTPLHSAAEAGHPAVVAVLLKKGASAEATDDNQRTPLHLAVENLRYDAAKLLIDANVDKEVPEQSGWTPLYWATIQGDYNIANLLLTAGANAKAQSSINRETPLHWACFKGHLDISRLLVNKGAEKEAEDCNKRTPLFWAARGGHDDIARLLIDLGAEKNVQDVNGQTPLHVAAIFGT
ncbi:hypothetical protein FGADI_7068 [Fusarium gaditjirri]|uniref:Ankyrin repeat protein n=1 Tax=Fusarium gaditjirri TaxID=282569 RepID=A0A8H4T5S8_9HYPO|nr:hypothetical protein FGADI_7068 [Fusarium gaditjirri]